MNLKVFFAAVFFSVALGANAQLTTVDQLKSHVGYLADDKLEGRATGSEGEKLASDYISGKFYSLGLLPAGDNGTYLEAFDAFGGKELGDSNFLIVNKRYDPNGTWAYPHPMSSNGFTEGKIINVNYGITATGLGYDDYNGINATNKIALIRFSSPDGNSSQSKYLDYLDERSKIKNAAEHGAIGVIFYTTDSTYELPTSEYKKNISSETIPVWVVDSSIARILTTYSKKIEMAVELNPIIRTGHNVLGFIDNGAAETVVIGAHYDHLGHGEIDGSLYRGKPAIHNGADDNASGVSLIIELARKLKNSDLKNNNYLVVAFSGEEMGLFGSKALMNSTIINKYHINYMLNYDMVGRLDTARTVIINGVGTSADWNVIHSVTAGNLKLQTTESGIGPSDQTSFYLKDIPVLHFFTGSHADYHKPSDDFYKINFQGIESILNYSYALIDSLNDNGKINFTKTKDDTSDKAPKFSVTMGVVPDYAYSGKGMRIDGVSDGKPAQKAGLLAGDIVLKLGDFEIVDMMSYMQALGKFKKGESTTVTILRNNSEMQIPVQF